MSTNLSVIPQAGTSIRERLDDPAMIQTLKDTVAKGATDSEFRMFLEICRSTGLNPFLKEIWCAVPMKNGQRSQYGSVLIMAGRDGYLRVANDHPMFDGIETRVERNEQTKVPVKAVCTVWRKDRSHPTICEAYYSEYYKAGYEGKKSIWDIYASAMIGKVAEVLALKRSFSINGVVTEEEIGSQEEPHTNGSREAQQNVAAELIESGRQQLEATKTEVLTDKPKAPLQPKMLKGFQEMKGLLGEADYYRILNNFGYAKSNQIEDETRGKVVYKAMKGWLNVSEPWTRLENRDKARFATLLAAEGHLTIASAVAAPDSAEILLRIEMAMSVPAKPESALHKLAEFASEDADLFWRVAGNNGCGSWAEVEALSPAAQDKLIAMIQVEKELGV